MDVLDRQPGGRMDPLSDLIPMRTGHFRLESGHHGQLWLELESLFVQPDRVRPLAVQLAQRLEGHRPDLVCGPLVEGAFVALLVASALGVPFTYTQPQADPVASGLYPVRYRLPGALRDRVRGKRVAIVNDVINAGSAVRGTFEDLQSCGAEVAAMGTLLVLGEWAAGFSTARAVPLEVLAARPNPIWAPADCPLCRQGITLEC
jgi:orotate phosphoribosyltransferase